MMKIFMKLSAVLLAIVLIFATVATFSAKFVFGIRGDADGDGEVTILDATRIQRVLVGYNKEVAPYTKAFGDTNGDGLDILDATAIQRKLVDFADPYGIGRETVLDVEIPTEAPTERPTEVPTQEPTNSGSYELPPV